MMCSAVPLTISSDVSFALSGGIAILMLRTVHRKSCLRCSGTSMYAMRSPGQVSFERLCR